MPLTTALKELTLTRSFQAPPSVVWDAWTDPVAFRLWFGPVGWDITDCAIDLRPGGHWSTTQRSPDGALHPTGGQYLVVDPPRHLGFNWVLSDPDGTVVMEAEHHVRLVARDDGTELTLEIRILTAGPGSEGFVSGVKQGWTGTLGKLATFLGD
jgi:uncharacterized protein YndB with AHSA1/START domain